MDDKQTKFVERVGAAIEHFIVAGDGYGLHAALVLFAAQVIEAHRDLEVPESY